LALIFLAWSGLSSFVRRALRPLVEDELDFRIASACVQPAAPRRATDARVNEESMLTPQERKAKVRSVVRVASGNFLEMYDFMVYGYLSQGHSATEFFPSQSEFASLMAALATFGAGFLMRPLGALDPRRLHRPSWAPQGLIVTLALMAIGTLSIAVFLVRRLWNRRTAPGPARRSAARLLRRGRVGRRVRVPVGGSPPPAGKGFLHFGQPAAGQVGVFRRKPGRLAQPIRLRSAHDCLGLAHPAADRLRHHPLRLAVRRSLVETDDFLERQAPSQPDEIFRSTMTSWRSCSPA